MIQVSLLLIIDSSNLEPRLFFGGASLWTKRYLNRLRSGHFNFTLLMWNQAGTSVHVDCVLQEVKIATTKLAVDWCEWVEHWEGVLFSSTSVSLRDWVVGWKRDP